MEQEMVLILKEINETLKQIKEEISEVSTAIRETNLVEEEE